jgi:amino acid adenylation domain-containing protein
MLLAQLLQRKADRRDTFPMSYGQQGLWLTHQLEPRNPAYNISFASQIRSRVDAAALRRTLQTLVKRHATLRTTFAEQDGKLVQRVHETMPTAFQQIDASQIDETELQQQLQAAISAPFDLARGPLLRMQLFTRDADDHVLLSVAHHIAMDFWSLIVMLMEIREIYPAAITGRSIELSPPESSYCDFVQWQRDMLAGDQGARLADYWQQQLAGAPHVLELPLDRPRPPQFSHRAGVVPCQISAELTTQLVDLATANHATIYSVLLAAFQYLLSRYCGQQEFLVGTPFVGRSRPGFENTVGYFVNLLPIRASIDDKQSFRELLRQVSATAMDALEHQDYPFPLIVDRLRVVRDPSRPPLVQASFTLERAQRTEEAGRGRFLFPNSKAHLNVGGLLGETYYVKQQSCHHELELVLEQSSGMIHGLLCYCAELFDEPTIVRMTNQLEVLLQRVAAHPDLPLHELTWFDDAERIEVVERWNQTRVPVEPTTLHKLFEQQVRKTPDAMAITALDRSYSYRQLDAWSNRLARELVARGLHPGQLVALGIDRSAVKIALILATLKSGGVCVPIDPQTPAERVRSILTDTAAVLVIAQGDNVERLRAATAAPVLTAEQFAHSDRLDEDPGPPPAHVNSDDLAYVIYTSGSTGQPKGVMVEHRAICNTICWRERAVPVDATDRVLLMLPCFFDASFSVVFSTLTQGGQLVLVPPGEERNPNTLLELVDRENVTILPAPPRLLQVLVEHPDMKKCQSLRQAQTGGEAMSAELCHRIVHGLNVPLANMYGPTEAAVETTAWVCQPGDHPTCVPIGKAIDNVQTYILDTHQRPVPRGVPGELYIAGAGLARGYLNDPEQTEERFVQISVDGATSVRAYRTGDLCRWLDDGNIEFLGRLDQQVKLRGYRIELAEIEYALTALPEVHESAVTLCAPTAQEPRLVAFVVPVDNSRNLAEDALRRQLRSRLPTYMIPSQFDVLESLPRTASGKLDRQALPNPQARRPALRDYIPPRTPLEHFLVDTCQNVLNVEKVGMQDGFYELGGTSIQGATLLAILQDELGRRIQTTALFELTRIAELSDYLAEHYADAVSQRFGSESTTAGDRRSLSSDAAGACETSGPDLANDLIVPIQPEGQKTPLFMVHPPGGIVICYQPLARYLGINQPLYGIRARGLHGEEDLPDDLAVMAQEYVAQMRSVQPQGPYRLGGWSLGGVVAYEMAQQLMRSGQQVEALVLLDTTIPQGDANREYLAEAEQTGLEYGIDLTLEQLGELGPEEQLPYLFEHARKLGVIDEQAPESLIQQVLEDLKRLFHRHLELASRYAIKPYAERVILIRPQETPVSVATTPDRGWRQLAREVAVHFVPGQHHSMVKEPHVAVLAQVLNEQLDSAAPGS